MHNSVRTQNIKAKTKRFRKTSKLDLNSQHRWWYTATSVNMCILENNYLSLIKRCTFLAHYVQSECSSNALILLNWCQQEHRDIDWWVWHGYLSGAKYKWFVYGPTHASTIPSSHASLKSRMMPAYLEFPEREAIKWVSVCIINDTHIWPSWILSKTTWVSWHQKGKTRKVKLNWIYYSKI